MSSNLEYLQGEFIEEGQAQLEEQEHRQAQQAIAVQPQNSLELGGLSYADDKTLMSVMATKATMINAMVKNSGCIQKIQGRDYVKVEGWEMLAQMCGARAIVTDIKAGEDGSYLAFAELRAHDGRILQTAQMLCGDESDRMWATRPQYAKLSMAQTRVKGKVCRMEFAPLMAMGGFATTPVEEMPSEQDTKQAAPNNDPKLIGCLVRNGESIAALCDALIQTPDDPSGESLERAAVAWDEMTDEDKMTLWNRTRGKGGVFTSAEKKIMQSTEFKELRPSWQESPANKSAEAQAWDDDLAKADEERK